MNLIVILIIILIIFSLGGLPQLSGSWHSLGYGPSGIGFIIVVVLIVILLSRV